MNINNRYGQNRIVIVSKNDGMDNVNYPSYEDDDDCELDSRWSKGNDRKVKVLKFKEHKSK